MQFVFVGSVLGSRDCRWCVLEIDFSDHAARELAPYLLQPLLPNADCAQFGKDFREHEVHVHVSVLWFLWECLQSHRRSDETCSRGKYKRFWVDCDRRDNQLVTKIFVESP